MKKEKFYYEKKLLCRKKIRNIFLSSLSPFFVQDRNLRLISNSASNLKQVLKKSYLEKIFLSSLYKKNVLFWTLSLNQKSGPWALDPWVKPLL